MSPPVECFTPPPTDWSDPANQGWGQAGEIKRGSNYEMPSTSPKVSCERMLSVENPALFFSSAPLKYECYFNKIVSCFFSFLKAKGTPSYLFGSAVWRTILEKQDGHDYDIVILIDKNYDEINQYLEKIASNGYIKNIGGRIDDEYEIFGNLYRYDHIELSAENDIKLDINFVSDIESFKENMSDIDCGMMMYDIINERHCLAGKKKYEADCESKIFCQYLNDCVNEEINLSYIRQKMRFRSSYWRIIKMMELYGFGIDLNENFIEVCRLFEKSYCNSICEVTPKYKRLFVEKCQTEASYHVIKTCVKKYLDYYANPKNRINWSWHDLAINKLLDAFISFA
ncbi:MAG: hypothetical protein EBQ92_07860, partial [Proteobacteria bacterium]|nr:hypothetical protein [Pseudomonadota bacterium]